MLFAFRQTETALSRLQEASGWWHCLHRHILHKFRHGILGRLSDAYCGQLVATRVRYDHWVQSLVLAVPEQSTFWSWRNNKSRHCTESISWRLLFYSWSGCVCPKIKLILQNIRNLGSEHFRSHGFQRLHQRNPCRAHNRRQNTFSCELRQSYTSFCINWTEWCALRTSAGEVVG